MKGKRFTEEQSGFTLRQAKSGIAVEEICRKIASQRSDVLAEKEKIQGHGGRRSTALAPTGRGKS